MGWPWVGLGLALGWRWVGLGLALGWPWVGLELALGWPWVGLILRDYCTQSKALDLLHQYLRLAPYSISVTTYHP